MAKFPIAKQIRIQRKQNKNRMVGQTFNPSGITSEQIRARAENFVQEWSRKTPMERYAYAENIKRLEEVWQGSNPWEWLPFREAFGYEMSVLRKLLNRISALELSIQTTPEPQKSILQRRIKALKLSIES